MGGRGIRKLLVAAFGVAALGISASAAAVPDAGRKVVQPRPKLIVAISVDQFSSDLFNGWRGRYSRGLKRLGNEGITYPNGYQAHAATETCPGHSTLLTGRHPSGTGIIRNDFYDPVRAREVYCLEDPLMRPAHNPDADPTEGRSSRNLKVSTLGDWLKAQSPRSRVLAISGKDRGAILMGGHKADGEFWLVPGHGFTTFVPAGQSGEKALAPVAALNRRIQDEWSWKPAVPDWTYADESCKALEREWVIDGQTWRSQVPPTAWDVNSPTFIRDQFMASPLLDELILEGARHLIQTYKLGQGEATDLLAVSLSANDYIGHRYGTQGPEMCDQQVRLDRELGRFLNDLEQLGVPFLVVLSADHGGLDFPERLNAVDRREAGRVESQAFMREVNAALRGQLGLDYDPLHASGLDQLWVVDRNGRSPASDFRKKVVEVALPLLRQRPEVEAVFDREVLLNTPVDRTRPVDELSLQERFALSTVADRSADISVALKPFLQTTMPEPGVSMTGHGTVWNYDRRVPILFWWPGVTPQERPLPVPTVDIAPTLAHTLGIQPEADLDGTCRDLADFGTGSCMHVKK